MEHTLTVKSTCSLKESLSRPSSLEFRVMQPTKTVCFWIVATPFVDAQSLLETLVERDKTRKRRFALDSCVFRVADVRLVGEHKVDHSSLETLRVRTRLPIGTLDATTDSSCLFLRLLWSLLVWNNAALALMSDTLCPFDVLTTESPTANKQTNQTEVRCDWLETLFPLCGYPEEISEQGICGSETTEGTVAQVLAVEQNKGPHMTVLSVKEYLDRTQAIKTRTKLERYAGKKMPPLYVPIALFAQVTLALDERTLSTVKDIQLDWELDVALRKI